MKEQEENSMSTREIVYSLIDELSEKQLQGLVLLLQGYCKKETSIEKVQGILSDYANTSLISEEKNAWEKAVKEKYENA